MKVQRALVMGGLPVKVGDKVVVTVNHHCGDTTCDWPHEITKTAEVREIYFEGAELLIFRVDGTDKYFSAEPSEVVRIRKAGL